jgi:thiamine-phosphate pyrophosphorylase
VSFSPPEGQGPLRRERLRTARLYFVCGARPHGADPEPLLRAALGGGVDIVQLREKQLGRAEIERAASTFRRMADNYSALFIVNDDPDLARIVNADGVHVGQDDISVADARAALGNQAIIGQSTHSEEQIAAAEGRDIDYFAVGPVWETPTKPGRPAVGLELITHAAERARAAGPAQKPFFAIGGISPLNAGEVITAGAKRMCVVRAIRDAPHPEVAAEALRRAFDVEGSRRGVAPGG